MAFVEKLKNILLGTPDLEDFEDDEFFEEESNRLDHISPARSRAKTGRPTLTLMDNPLSTRSYSYEDSFSAKDMVAVTINPKNCEEAMLIIDRLKEGNFVVFSLKKTNHQNIEELTLLPGGQEESKESIFKFICGGIYTLNAEISKFDEGIFIAGPANCKIDEISLEMNQNLKKTGTTHAFRKGIF